MTVSLCIMPPKSVVSLTIDPPTFINTKSLWKSTALGHYPGLIVGLYQDLGHR
jgi:hypothetical protein